MFELCFLFSDAPNVTIDLSDFDPVENKQLRISCVAVGRPNTYTYTSMIQTWGGIGIRNFTSSTTGIIDIDKLQLEDSGTYTCSVNNGIYDRNHQLDQIAKKDILVKGMSYGFFDKRPHFPYCLRY